MRRAGALLATSVIAFGSVLALAGANRDRVKDPSGDSSEPGLDVASATVKHKGKKTLVHTVKMAGPLPTDLSDDFITLQLNLDRDRDCESEFRPPPFGRNPLIRCGVGVTSKFGRVSKPNGRTLKYSFKKRLIGSPRKYGWRILVSSNCQTSCEQVDSLPDERILGQARYVKHKLN